MDSGLALLLVVLGILKKAGIYDTSRELMAMLAGLLCTCVAVDAFFIFCEVLTMAYPGAAGADTLATSNAIAGALRMLEFDLVITGRQAIDGDTAR